VFQHHCCFINKRQWIYTDVNSMLNTMQLYSDAYSNIKIQ